MNMVELLAISVAGGGFQTTSKFVKAVYNLGKKLGVLNITIVKLAFKGDIRC